MVFITVIETVFDHRQPLRPWGDLLSQGFEMPIRENWRFRLVVNLVWFARNYSNAVVMSAIAVAWWYPGFLVTVVTTLVMHSNKEKTALRAGLQVAQVVSLLLNNYLYGWVAGFLFSALITNAILTHAVFTPYTDERVKRYRECLKQHKDAKTIDTCDNFAPRTPVMSFTATGKGNFPLVDRSTAADAAEELLPRAASAARLEGAPPGFPRVRRPSNTPTTDLAAASRGIAASLPEFADRKPTGPPPLKLDDVAELESPEDSALFDIEPIAEPHSRPGVAVRT